MKRNIVDYLILYNVYNDYANSSDTKNNNNNNNNGYKKTSY